MKVELIADLKGHGAPIYDIQLLNDILYSASSDKMLASWSTDTNEPHPFSVKAEAGIYCFDISESRLQIGCSSGSLNVIDLVNKKELRNFKIHKKGVYLIHRITELDLLVTGGGDGVLNFFQHSSMELIRSMKVSTLKIRSAYYSSNEGQLYIGCGEGLIRIFELDYFNEVKSFKASEESVNVIVKHPTKPVIISSGKDGYIHFWKENIHTKIRSIAAHNMTIYALQFNPKGDKCVSVSRDKSVKVWDSETFDMVEKLERIGHKGHTHSVNSLAWINSSEFYTAGDDRIIKRWKILN